MQEISRLFEKERLLLQLQWRSLFIQAIWNFERLQNIGFAYGILPLLRTLYPDPAKRREVLLSHISFFNTHPYMVNIIFGLVAALEEEARDGKPIRREDIDTLKNNMAGPLAAIGDTFFWATWRPFTALLSISIVLFFHGFNNFSGTWLAPVVFLAVYNSIHVPFRYWTLRISYKLRTRIVEIIAELEFQYVVNLVRRAGVVLVLGIALYYVWFFAKGVSEVLLYIGIFAGTLYLGCQRVPPVVLFYGVIGFGICLALLRGL